MLARSSGRGAPRLEGYPSSFASTTSPSLSASSSSMGCDSRHCEAPASQMRRTRNHKAPCSFGGTGSLPPSLVAGARHSSSEAGPWAGSCSRLRHAAQRGGAEVRGRLRDLLADGRIPVGVVSARAAYDRPRRRRDDAEEREEACASPKPRCQRNHCRLSSTRSASAAVLNIVRALVFGAPTFFRTRSRLAVEILALRHQLGVLKRSVKRPRLTNADRGLWVVLSRTWARWNDTLIIMKPATVIAWHRAGFRRYWTWRSRHKGGRPRIDPEVRALIQRMATANRWGAPRIHGEWLKLGIRVSQATVSKYMPRRRKPPSQTWRTFLDTYPMLPISLRSIEHGAHVNNLVSVDFFSVPTVLFHVLFVFVVLAHDRRRILGINVTSSPSASWAANQIVQAFPWETAPR